jgi:hypothetical protein
MAAHWLGLSWIRWIMGFASLLEDLVDLQNERDHLAKLRSGARTSRQHRPESRQTHQHENADFDDAAEAERYYRSQLKIVQRFIEYYKQERQLLEMARSDLPKHMKAIEEFEQALQQIPMIEDWPDDEARWNVVQGIEKHLNHVVRNGGFANALSPDLLDRLGDSAGQILEKANRLFHDLSDVLRAPVDSRVSNTTRSDLESCVTLLELALTKFDKDCQSLATIAAKLDAVRTKWTTFIDLYTTLPLRLQRRLTIKDLSRLNLHEEQERFVSLNHDGCYQLAGVSGSGKTIILVNRALRLANERPELKVYVLTINRSLATQLKGTLDVVNRGQLPTNLEVLSLYDLFQKCISLCLPAEKFRLTDDRSGERIDRSWRDFVAHRGRTIVQNVFADKTVTSLLQSLATRTGSTGAAVSYLRDEVQGVQSAYLKQDRGLYFDESRMGRVLGLGGSQRDAVLKVVQAWEEWLEVGGLCDIQTVSLTAAELLHQADAKSTIRRHITADVILVDEAQDVSTVELIGLRHLLADPNGENALFLAGDVCQKVYSKHQSIERAGFANSYNTGSLLKNYRNTKEILTAAFRTIASFPLPPTVLTGTIIKPEMSPYVGSIPLAVDCTGISQEEYIKNVVRFIAQERVAVVTENPVLLESLLSVLNDDHMVNCVHVRSNVDIDRWREIPSSPTEVAVFLSTFDAVKGFEFDTVIAADVSERREGFGSPPFNGFPPVGIPEGEFWRCATKLYVACTRARNHLILTHVGKPSILLKDCKNAFKWIRAEDFQLLHAIAGDGMRPSSSPT